MMGISGNRAMEDWGSFFRLARREEGLERAPRLKSNAARREKGRSPQGRFLWCFGEAIIFH
jgi:hypothetical protein